MELEGDVLERVRTYESLSRWERSELGRDLRRLGLSYGEIMELIPVKKSTLATWCRDVELSQEQIEAIKQRRAPEPGVPRDTQRGRRWEIERLRKRARSQVESLFGDSFWIAGVVLYWAEGGKTRNDFKIANADPRTHRLFVSWIRRYLDPDVQFSLQLHLHEGNDEQAARQHWSEAIGLPDANFHKTFIKPAGNRASQEPSTARRLHDCGSPPRGSVADHDGMGGLRSRTVGATPPSELTFQARVAGAIGSATGS